MDKINLALIGCGYWGKNHLKTMQGIGEIELKYVVDAQMPKVKIPEESIFIEEYRKILNDENLDGAVIATPSNTHYEIAKDFLERGKNVFVEKPLTTNSSEARELCEIARKNDNILMTGEIFRFNSAIKYIKDTLDDGKLGKLRYIESRRVAPGPIRNDVSAMWDLLSHDIYISNHLVGKSPESVAYSGISHNRQFDDIVSLNLKYENPRVISTMYANWEHPIKERRLVVGGNKRAISFNDVEPSKKIEIYDMGIDFHSQEGGYGFFQASIRDGDILIPKIKLSEPLRDELVHFTNCIYGKEKCISSGYEGLETVKILESAEKSRAQGGLEIKIQNN